MVDPDSRWIGWRLTLPAEFVEIVTTRKVDKTAIKRAIESGAQVSGAVLIRGTRLAIR